LVEGLIDADDLLLSTFGNVDVGLKSAAVVSVLVLGEAVGDGVVADVTDVLTVLNLLHKVVSTSVVDVKVSLNLARERFAAD
jgi:hypothetical protein